MTLTFEDETKGDDGIVTFDGLAPITVTVVNRKHCQCNGMFRCWRKNAKGTRTNSFTLVQGQGGAGVFRLQPRQGRNNT